ncbi:MAG: hypothetical protein IPN46_19360 [Saprospiraceae bacterium]|nr:hypothetical protein [Saprospiraceae bacterium]
MKSISLNQQGKIETYVIATIIFTITFLSNFSKELFVEQSGKFEIFGNNLGFILVIGLLWKWKYIREIVSVLTLFVIFVIMSSVLMIKSLSIPIFVLLVTMSFSFYLTSFSANVRAYLDEAQNSSTYVNAFFTSFLITNQFITAYQALA